MLNLIGEEELADREFITKMGKFKNAKEAWETASKDEGSKSS